MRRSKIQLGLAWVLSVATFGCGGVGDGSLDPDAIPSTPAALRFDGAEMTASDESAAWLATGTSRLISTSGRGVSCANQGGELPESGEIRVSVRLPSNARTGDIFELPSDAPMGEGAGAGLSIMGNVTFSFGEGVIVVDERSEERVIVRLDVTSPDGSKSARGQVSSPFCAD